MAGELAIRAFLTLPFALTGAADVEAMGAGSGDASLGCRRVDRGLREGGGVGSASETSEIRFRLPFLTADSMLSGAAVSLLAKVEDDSACGGVGAEEAGE